MYCFMSKHWCFFLSRSPLTPRHRCVIKYEVVDGSLRKICNYQRNVPQHCYLLDTLATSIFLQKMKTPVLLPTLNFLKNKLGIDKKKIRELVTFCYFCLFVSGHIFIIVIFFFQ